MANGFGRRRVPDPWRNGGSSERGIGSLKALGGLNAHRTHDVATDLSDERRLFELGHVGIDCAPRLIGLIGLEADPDAPGHGAQRPRPAVGSSSSSWRTSRTRLGSEQCGQEPKVASCQLPEVSLSVHSSASSKTLENYHHRAMPPRICHSDTTPHRLPHHSLHPLNLSSDLSLGGMTADHGSHTRVATHHVPTASPDVEPYTHVASPVVKAPTSTS